MAEDRDYHGGASTGSPTPSSRAARSHGSGAGAAGAGGGAVSRRNCSTAAITAAASSAEAADPCNSRRGRRFTPQTLAPGAARPRRRVPARPQTAHSPSPRMTWNGTLRFQSMNWFIVSRPKSTGMARSRTASSNDLVPTRAA
jgi:hypothetical protein